MGTTFALVVGCSGGGEPDGPPPDPIRLVAVSPVHTAVVAGSMVTPAPHVQARNSKGPVRSTPITFDFRGLSPTVTIAAGDDGSAEAIWFLPKQMGTFTMVARLAGGDSVVFSAEALQPPPPTMHFSTWPGGTYVGELASGMTAVEVRDGFGDPMPNIAVQFEVQSGGGTLIGAQQLTNANGLAAVGGWRLGPSERLQTLVAIGPNGVRDSITIGALPARFEAISDTVQRGYTWKPAPLPPTVQAWDALGKPMPDVPVGFASSTGSGVYVSTDSNGTARLEPWIADIEPGDYFATASTDGWPLVVFRLTAVVPRPVRSVILSGNGQTGLAGNYLGPRPEIQYFDSAGSPIINLPVTWATSGDGFVLKPATRTDENGLTSNEGWRLGTTPGPQTLTASTESLAPTTFTATAQPMPAKGYGIDVRLVGEVQQLTTVDSGHVTHAVERWTRAIIADLPDLPVAVADSVCGAAVDETVDDLLILVAFDAIDGRGGILGGAAPCVLRDGSLLPAVGIVVLDSSDVLDKVGNILYEVLSHEFGHVIGIGTLWELKGLVALTTHHGPYGYFGEIGRTAFHGMASNGQYFWKPSVPIDNSGIPGSDKAHWAPFGLGFHEELMIPYLTSLPALSALSIASLRDLGYLTTDREAEEFSFPAFSPGLVPVPAPMRLRELDIRRPMVTLSSTGRRVRTIPRR